MIHGQVVRDMFSVYPDAKVVNIIRDGRDVLISERFRNFVEESKFLTAEDKRILTDLQTDSAPFSDGRRSIFTDTFIRNIVHTLGQRPDRKRAEARRLYEARYHTLRYEDLLANPFAEMTELWEFLGVQQIPASLAEAIQSGMSSTPDEEWQAKRNEGIASFLPKGQAAPPVGRHALTRPSARLARSNWMEAAAPNRKNATHITC